MSTSHEKKSRMITIFRAGSFLSRAQGKDVEDFFATSKKSIGSYWESTSSKRIGTGLSFIEEGILMPMLIDAESTDREFRKKVTDFFVDIDTQVPFNVGRPLEIGLTLDDSAPLHMDKDPEKCNLPINVMDYIRYRHALKHPHVAPSKEEAEGNGQVEFYIFDASLVTKKNTKRADEKDAAFQIYLTIKPELTKVDMMLTLLGVDPRQFTGADAVDLKIDALRLKAEKEPAAFITVHKTNDLEIQYWIKAMLNTGVLKNIGPKYFDAETQKLLGNTLEELVYFFKDDTNSDSITTLKARLQEGMKKPVTKGKQKVQNT